MARIPDCDLCGDGTPALYDAAIPGIGSWAYMCSAHFEQYGCETGVGSGQKLIEKVSP